MVGGWFLNSATIIGAAGLMGATRVPCHTAITATATTHAVANPATTGRRSHCQKPNRLAGASNALSNSARAGRIAQQIAQRLFAGQGVEQFLIFQGGGKQRLLLFRGQRAGGVSAQQFLNVFGAHRLGGSQLPPMASSRFLRQRWSQV